MKRITVMLVLGLTASFCGCATTGYQRASQARSEIAETRVVTIKAHQDLVAALRAAQNLTAKETTALQPPYQSFAAAVKGLEAEAQELAPRGEAIQKSGNAYIAAWQEDLGVFRNPDIRARSAERRLEVAENFRKLSSELLAAEVSLRPLLVALKDMRLYLSIDLTASGVSSAQEQAGRITTQAVDAGQHLLSLLAVLDRVATELSPVKPAKEAPTPTK
jgi:rubrerythrin